FGPGWWRFIYEKTQQVVVADPNITFKVDMADYTGTIATGVFLNGSFNNWCGNCTPMTNTSGSIWEVTVPLTAGPIQYKFTIDGWNDQEFFFGGEPCVDTIADGFFNRYYVVSSDATLPAVCFGSCDVCPTSSLNENELNIEVMPNPANEQFTVTSDEAINQIQMIDMLGKQVRILNLNSTKSTTVDVSDLNKGVYTIVVYSVNGRNTSRVIVE
ncbi:MAG: T9SS type A sorting domain-containing protein, partial [Bacteroidetes bacterium]|nr:T9SS type A sorting domain-containing protein [Bacteroidota bacterium]